MSFEAAIRREAGDTTSAVGGNPDAAVLVYGQTIWNAARCLCEDSSIRVVAILVEVVHEYLLTGAIVVIELASIWRASDAVRHGNVVVEQHRLTLLLALPVALADGLDPVELACFVWPLGPELVGAKGADQNVPVRVTEEVVEGRDALRAKCDTRLPILYMADILARDDDASVGVQCNSTDASALRDYGRGIAIRIAAVDAAVVSVGEIEPVLRVDAGAFEQASAGDQDFERRGRGHEDPIIDTTDRERNRAMADEVGGPAVVVNSDRGCIEIPFCDGSMGDPVHLAEASLFYCWSESRTLVRVHSASCPSPGGSNCGHQRSVHG